MLQNKKAAMEMSIGTIVTIVLLMSVLVLGLVLITNIFSGATTSVKTIDDKVKSEINNIFKDDNAILAISPSDKKMKIAQGTKLEGFVFAINNINTEATKFTYKVFIDPLYDLSKNCGSLTLREAESWLDQQQSAVDVPKNSKSSGTLVPFTIPENAPKCSIPYTLDIFEGGELYAEEKIWVTVV